MNRHTAIVAISSVIIAGTLAFSASNAAVADGMRFEKSGEMFRLFDMINRNSIGICNTMPLYAHIDGITVTISNEGRQVGRLALPGGIIEPGLERTERGAFMTNSLEEAQYLALHFDAMHKGVIPERIHASSLVVTTAVNTRILGVIPYSSAASYQALAFIDTMNEGCPS